MKKLITATFSIIIFFTACNKSGNNLPEDNGCIEQIFIPVTAHSISAAEVATVNYLFSKNKISSNNLRYYKYVHDTLKTLYPPFTKYDEKNVSVDQYINGLKLFTGDMVFEFLNDSLDGKGGDFSAGTSLDNSPNLNVRQLRKLFIDDIEKFDHASAKYNDSCFKAEFGYYNINGGASYTPELLVKAWRITLKNSTYPSEYLVAFYEDVDGKLIVYDNGIRTFK